MIDISLRAFAVAMDRLEVVAGGVREKRRVVVVGVVGTRSRGAVIDQTGVDAGLMEAVDVALSSDVLDRIDEIVPPGVNVNPTDGGWANPGLEPAARRR